MLCRLHRTVTMCTISCSHLMCRVAQGYVCYPSKVCCYDISANSWCCVPFAGETAIFSSVCRYSRRTQRSFVSYRSLLYRLVVPLMSFSHHRNTKTETAARNTPKYVFPSNVEHQFTNANDATLTSAAVFKVNPQRYGGINSSRCGSMSPCVSSVIVTYF